MYCTTFLSCISHDSVHIVAYIGVCANKHKPMNQGRLHHINDGANAPWKSKGEVFAAFLGN